MHKLICFLILSSFSYTTWAQNQPIIKQSIIYDATAIMNAKFGVEALLIPKPGASEYDAIHSISLKKETKDVSMPTSFTIAGQSNVVIYEILRRNAGLPTNASIATITAAYNANPFLNDIITIAPPAFATNDMKKIKNPDASTNVSGIGQDVLGNLVNGTGDFLIERAQEEISISVFEKLKAVLERNPEFGKLFPTTCALIKPVEAYEYNKALTAFKAAINEDLNFLPSRVSTLYDIPRYKLLNAKVPALTFVFSGTSVLSELNGEKNFASSIYTFSHQDFLLEKNNYASFLNIMAIMSNSLIHRSLADEDDKPLEYIHKDFVKLATHQNTALMAFLSKIYLGLIWQHTKDINFTTGSNSQTFAQLMSHWYNKPNIADAIISINQTLTIVHALDDKIKQIKTNDEATDAFTSGSKARVKRFLLYPEIINAALGLTEIYINPANPTFSTHIKEVRKVWPSFATSVSGMIKDFHIGEYNLGIAKLEDVLTSVADYLEAVEKNKAASTNLTSSFAQILNAQKLALVADKAVIQAKITALPSSPTGNAEIDANVEADRQMLNTEMAKIDEAIEDINYQEKNKKAVLFSLSKIIKYTNLLAAVTKAENSAAVEALLESYALPAGSSRLKKVSEFNLAVNAYVGGFYRPKGIEGEGFTNNYGLSAPIGFTFSTGFQKVGSLSVLAGVFDIGSTIRYKLDNEGKYQQDISLAGIVSPSAHLVYGFPFYLPLSLGAGCQWISPVTSNNNKIHLKPTFNAFVGVDIPLFNLAGGRPK